MCTKQTAGSSSHPRCLDRKWPSSPCELREPSSFSSQRAGCSVHTWGAYGRNPGRQNRSCWRPASKLSLKESKRTTKIHKYDKATDRRHPWLYVCLYLTFPLPRLHNLEHFLFRHGFHFRYGDSPFCSFLFPLLLNHVAQDLKWKGIEEPTKWSAVNMTTTTTTHNGSTAVITTTTTTCSSPWHSLTLDRDTPSLSNRYAGIAPSGALSGSFCSASFSSYDLMLKQ